MREDNVSATMRKIQIPISSGIWDILSGESFAAVVRRDRFGQAVIYIVSMDRRVR